MNVLFCKVSVQGFLSGHLSYLFEGVVYSEFKSHVKHTYGKFLLPFCSLLCVFFFFEQMFLSLMLYNLSLFLLWLVLSVS